MKNKNIILSLTFLGVFLINTILVVTNIYAPVDDFVHNLVMQLYCDASTIFFKGITFLGSTVFIVAFSLALFIIFLLKKKNIKAYFLAALIIISTIINNVIKLLVRRPRPEYMMVTESTFAYPSGHTMASATLYGLLIVLILQSNLSKFNKIFYVTFLILLILLIGLSRIYLGAHYFSDVIGSIILSTSILFAYLHISKKH